jgi:6-phosphogluconate dehydrogenase
MFRQATMGVDEPLDVGRWHVAHVANVASTWQASPMQMAMIGLGRMGFNMVKRLIDGGHECVVHDLSETPIAALEAEGAKGARSLEEVIAAMQPPRHVWIMVPAAFVGATVDRLSALLEPGDVIIDGGNSWYRDDVDRAAPLAAKGIHYVDVGTSGGVFGLERGYCLMVGGDDEAVQRLAPIFDALAPGIDAAARTPGRTGEPAPEEDGWLHCGPNGAGHFVKMVHNGIEYGMMAAFAEGLNILAKANVGKAAHTKDAETAPLADPQYYQYDLDLEAITEVWRRGSVVSSWLLDLTAQALHADPQLSAYAGSVSDSGEGRWTVHAAIDEGVPTPVLAAALYQRFSSRGRSDVADKLLSAMRAGFGGHVEVVAEPRQIEAGLGLPADATTRPPEPDT